MFSLRSRFVFIFIFLSAPLYAGELESIRKDLERDLSHLRFVAGLELESSSQRRGAHLYQHPDINPSFHIHFASEPRSGSPALSQSEKILSFLKPELHFSFISSSASLTFTDYFRIESGIQFFTGGEFIRFIKDRFRDRSSRPLSVEVFTKLESQVFSWLALGVQIEKDIHEHNGYHSSIFNRLRIFQWIRQNQDVFNTFLGGEIGFADKAHNRYLYGPSASSGLSHYGIGFSLEWPKTIGDIQIGTDFIYSGLLGKNRKSEMSKEHTDYLTIILKLQRSFR